jgi:AcrR family transcriptional regulator
MSTRERILEAADHLFGEVGFDAATTRQIAERSEVNKALIHYHFGNKDDLFNTLLDRYYERLDDALRAALEAPGSLRDRLRRLIDAYVDFLSSNRNFSRMVQREASGGRHLDRVVARMVPIFERGTALLAHAYPETASGPLSGAQLLTSFYGMIVSYFTYSPVLEQLLGSDPLSNEGLDLRKRHLHSMVDLVTERLGEDRPTAAAGDAAPRSERSD